MDVPSLHTAKVKSQKIPKLLDLGSKRSGATKVFSAELPTFKFISNSALCILMYLTFFFFLHTRFSKHSYLRRHLKGTALPGLWAQVCLNFVSPCSCWLIRWRREQLKSWLNVFIAFSSLANVAITYSCIKVLRIPKPQSFGSEKWLSLWEKRKQNLV